MVDSDEVQAVEPSPRNVRQTSTRPRRVTLPASTTIVDLDTFDDPSSSGQAHPARTRAAANRRESSVPLPSYKRPPIQPTRRRQRQEQTRNGDVGDGSGLNQNDDDDDDDENGPDHIPGSNKKRCTSVRRHRASVPSSSMGVCPSGQLHPGAKSMMSSILTPQKVVTRLSKSKRQLKDQRTAAPQRPESVINLDDDQNTALSRRNLRSTTRSNDSARNSPESPPRLSPPPRYNRLQKNSTITRYNIPDKTFNQGQVNEDRRRRNATNSTSSAANAIPTGENEANEAVIDLVSTDSASHGQSSPSTASAAVANKEAIARRRSPRQQARASSEIGGNQTPDQRRVAEELVDLEADTLNAPYTGPTNLIFVYPPGKRGSVRVTAEERYRLDMRMYLNDSLIDFYIKYLEIRLQHQGIMFEPLPVFFSSFFFGRMSRKIPIDYEGVKNWTKNIDLFGKKFIFVPICDSFHWSLIIIINLHNLEKAVKKEHDDLDHYDAPKIVYVDSLDPERGDEFASKMIQYLSEEWVERKILEKEGKPTRKEVLCEFKKAIRIFKPNVPLQSNEYDCGLYVLQCLKMFLNDIDDFRERVTNEEFELQSIFSQAVIERLRFDIRVLMDKEAECWEWRRKNTGKSEDTVENKDDVKMDDVNDDSVFTDNLKADDGELNGMDKVVASSVNVEPNERSHQAALAAVRTKPAQAEEVPSPKHVAPDSDKEIQAGKVSSPGSTGKERKIRSPLSASRLMHSNSFRNEVVEQSDDNGSQIGQRKEEKIYGVAGDRVEVEKTSAVDSIEHNDVIALENDSNEARDEEGAEGSAPLGDTVQVVEVVKKNSMEQSWDGGEDGIEEDKMDCEKCSVKADIEMEMDSNAKNGSAITANLDSEAAASGRVEMELSEESDDDNFETNNNLAVHLGSACVEVRPGGEVEENSRSRVEEVEEVVEVSQDKEESVKEGSVVDVDIEVSNRPAQEENEERMEEEELDRGHTLDGTAPISASPVVTDVPFVGNMDDAQSVPYNVPESAGTMESPQRNAPPMTDNEVMEVTPNFDNIQPQDTPTRRQNGYGGRRRKKTGRQQAEVAPDVHPDMDMTNGKDLLVEVEGCGSENVDTGESIPSGGQHDVAVAVSGDDDVQFVNTEGSRERVVADAIDSEVEVASSGLNLESAPNGVCGLEFSGMEQATVGTMDEEP